MFPIGKVAFASSTSSTPFFFTAPKCLLFNKFCNLFLCGLRQQCGKMLQHSMVGLCWCPITLHVADGLGRKP